MVPSHGQHVERLPVEACDCSYVRSQCRAAAACSWEEVSLWGRSWRLGALQAFGVLDMRTTLLREAREMEVPAKLGTEEVG